MSQVFFDVEEITRDMRRKIEGEPPDQIAHWRDALSRVDVLLGTSSKRELQAVLGYCESIRSDLSEDYAKRWRHREVAQLLRRHIKQY